MAEEAVVPLGGTRSQAAQRLQVGVFGLAIILLSISVTNVFLNRADLVEEEAVPEAAPTVAAEQEAPQQSDPLADAGVVPELPAEPEEEQLENTAIEGSEKTAADDETAGEGEGNGGAAQP